MHDLLTDPEAQTVNPADARRIAEINRLRPIPKKSTTSYATTGDGGVTPVRAADVEERNRIVAGMAPTVNPVQTQWDNYEAHWKEIEQKSEQQRADEQAQRRQAEEARLAAVKTEIARKKAKQEFNEREQIIQMVIDQYGLSTGEAAVVRQRMLDRGRIHDTDLAAVICQEVILERGSRPVREVVPVDWRGELLGRKK